jgi:hypothetical protein
MSAVQHTSTPPVGSRRQRAVFLLLPALLVLTGCSAEESSLTPTAVLEQTEDTPYGQRDTVQKILSDSLEIALGAVSSEGTFALGSDYFNSRSPDISYSLEWPSSLGLNRLNLVSVWGTEDRLTFASKDVTGVCWYVDIKPGKDAPVVRYGASNDAACVASRVDRNEPVWDDFDFPLGAPVPAGAAPSATPGTTPAR